MKKEKLKILGIDVPEDVSTRELLSLSNEQLFVLDNVNKVAVLRELCEEFHQTDTEERSQITTSEQAVRLFTPNLQLLDHEECWMATLDSSLHLIRKEMVTSGSVNACLFDIRRIVKNCLISNATAVIISHNHPSDSVSPSVMDISCTKQLRDALKLFDINLVDHLIIGDSKYYSFADEMTINI